MTPQETHRFMDIFLRNHPEYSELIIILHNKDHKITLSQCGKTGEEKCLGMQLTYRILQDLLNNIQQ